MRFGVNLPFLAKSLRLDRPLPLIKGLRSDKREKDARLTARTARRLSPPRRALAFECRTRPVHREWGDFARRGHCFFRSSGPVFVTVPNRPREVMSAVPVNEVPLTVP